MSVEPETGDTNAQPRDAKLLHLMMMNLGVPEYGEKVPLQLMDFAHRYTHQILSSSLEYSDYARPNPLSTLTQPLTLDDLRLAISSRTNYSFRGPPPKEFLLEVAGERNRRPLPVVREGWGVRAPSERWCLGGREGMFVEEDEEQHGGNGGGGQGQEGAVEGLQLDAGAPVPIVTNEDQEMTGM
ncbi:TFIID-31kDa-domain-containing protein [Saitoella complicata NRRL Y-17804]|uniref:Transcription initiation factor TFIID subunit 9 n=1 Tax=Saitoella complicata (strain BCRC 22490 / CBS 7301 / JCM 7358 / NBRC 10748 / NRRL Y-17804) TaxID=698492 RepID=A0A0E9NAB8_SAICN|nr:TFIID-31kDa-domain-containing protein [Saitoella complicata NRRL Y-17804]ODQ55831.1 TFIID-31kDa-domain-containing protein [Saitoella complicata NRRL Y-17804]GAO46743.1 hypothetical protein G7K_0965-t1 [Saitoella complicata NRRL Y-17804]